MSADRQKTLAAAAALAYVEEGMTLGLGSGSTAEIFVRLLGERIKDGLRIQAVATSNQTAELAREVGVPLIDVDHVNHISVTVDGADEVDGHFQLIKFVPDGGHYILDCACGAIPDAAMVDYRLKALPGVVEHGLFIGLARVVIVGEDNEARVLEL